MSPTCKAPTLQGCQQARFAKSLRIPSRPDVSLPVPVSLQSRADNDLRESLPEQSDVMRASAGVRKSYPPPSPQASAPGSVNFALGSPPPPGSSPASGLPIPTPIVNPIQDQPVSALVTPGAFPLPWS